MGRTAHSCAMGARRDHTVPLLIPSPGSSCYCQQLLPLAAVCRPTPAYACMYLRVGPHCRDQHAPKAAEHLAATQQRLCSLRGLVHVIRLACQVALIHPAQHSQVKPDKRDSLIQLKEINRFSTGPAPRHRTRRSGGSRQPCTTKTCHLRCLLFRHPCPLETPRPSEGAAGG